MERLVMEQDDDPVALDPERLLIISVVAAQGGHFSGPALVNAFEHNRLLFDEHEIYSSIDYPVWQTTAGILCGQYG